MCDIPSAVAFLLHMPLFLATNGQMSIALLPRRFPRFIFGFRDSKYSERCHLSLLFTMSLDADFLRQSLLNDISRFQSLHRMSRIPLGGRGEFPSRSRRDESACEHSGSASAALRVSRARMHRNTSPGHSSRRSAVLLIDTAQCPNR